MSSLDSGNNSVILSSSLIKSLARQVGFDECGMARVEPLDDAFFGLRKWLSNGGHAGMSFMEQYVDMRHNPALLVDGAQTVISFLVGYKPSGRMVAKPRISCYAYGEDYHIMMKRKMYALISLLCEYYPGFEAKPCVDTVPISDKLWAVKSGLGWIGKNTLLVNKRLGSYCYIAELVTPSVVDEYDSPVESQCGNCTRCIDACPNHAIAPMQSEKCISYNTIENRDMQLPSDLKSNGYMFGCDCCQEVCPFNIQSSHSVVIDDQRMMQLEQLPGSDKHSFNKFKKNSPISRVTFEQWQRNRMWSESNG